MTEREIKNEHIVFTGNFVSEGFDISRVRDFSVQLDLEEADINTGSGKVQVSNDNVNWVDAPGGSQNFSGNAKVYFEEKEVTARWARLNVSQDGPGDAKLYWVGK